MLEEQLKQYYEPSGEGKQDLSQYEAAVAAAEQALATARENLAQVQLFCGSPS